MQHLYEKIHADDEFHKLEKRRGRFSWSLAAVVFIVYFSFILIIAFAPQLFAQAVFADQIVTWGIPVGLFVIILSFILTGVYVYRANTVFDRLIADIVKRTQQESTE